MSIRKRDSSLKQDVENETLDMNETQIFKQINDTRIETLAMQIDTKIETFAMQNDTRIDKLCMQNET